MTDQRPVIKVQKYANHPRISATVAIIAGLALIFGIVSTAIVYERQSHTVATIQKAVVAGTKRADLRWCTLFATLLTTPQPKNQPPPTAAQLKAERAFIKLIGEFDCPKS